MLVAGQRAGSVIAPQAPAIQIAQPGGFFARLIAYILDSLLLGVLYVPMYLLWQAQKQPADFKAAISTSPLDQLGQGAILALAILLVTIFYFAGSWHILGGSPGMLVMNLRVVDKDGKSPGFAQAIIRYVFLSLTAVVTWIPVAFTRGKRGFHDALSGTYVIHYLDAEKIAARSGLAAPAPAPAPAKAEPAAPMVAAPASPAVIATPHPLAPPAPAEGAAKPPPPATPAPASPSPEPTSAATSDSYPLPFIPAPPRAEPGFPTEEPTTAPLAFPDPIPLYAAPPPRAPAPSPEPAAPASPDEPPPPATGEPAEPEEPTSQAPSG
jgi:uncharacterized RDD family membrane protein YckC